MEVKRDKEQRVSPRFLIWASDWIVGPFTVTGNTERKTGLCKI